MPRRSLRKFGLRLGVEVLEPRALLAADLSLSVQLNGQTVAAAPGPQLQLGDAMTWTYGVTNTGDVPLSPPAISDDQGTPLVSVDDLIPSEVSIPGTVRGTLERHYPTLGTEQLVQHPTQPYMYASVRANNSIVIINTYTLDIEAEIPIGSSPRGLALSNDGSRLYVALSTTNTIGVFDTQTRTVLAPLQISQKPWDIEVGADGRLFVAGETSLMQLDPLTGASVGPNLAGTKGGGELEISPHKDRLYYAEYSFSPSRVTQWDLTTSPPTRLWFSDDASNGINLELSPDGQYMSFAAGSGQALYKIATFRTSDMAIVGSFNTANYPSKVAYSMDNSLAFTVNERSAIRIWDVKTFLQVGTISLGTSQLQGDIYKLQIDRSNARLYASTASGLRIYSTGLASVYNTGDLNFNGQLDVGETWQYRSSETAHAGQQARTITAKAVTDTSQLVIKTAPANFTVPAWSVALQTTVQGSLADNSPGVVVGAGTTVSREVVVTNPGQFPLSNVVVNDDNGTALVTSDDLTLALTSGDTNSNALLDPGEAWRYLFTIQAAVGQHQHTASMTALPVAMDGSALAGAVSFSMEDSCWYTGLNAVLQVETRINGLPANEASGPTFNPGDTLDLTYEVTNTGQVSVRGVSLMDDRGTPATNDDLRPIEASVPISEARGVLKKTFDIAGNFLLHPTLPYLYVAVESQNAVAIINTETLQLESQIFVGSKPVSIAISNDGSRLYVADSLSHFIGVIDTQTRTLLSPIQLNTYPFDLAVGADGRLFVTVQNDVGGYSVRQIDPATGQSVGPTFGGVSAGGKLLLNPAKDRLYVADYGGQALVLQYNVAVDPPVLLKTVSDNAATGEDLALNEDGTYLSFAAFVGQSNTLARYRTSDMTIVGGFANRTNYGVAFSHDDQVTYTASKPLFEVNMQVRVWDTNTFALLGTMPLPPNTTPYKLAVDRLDRRVFVRTDNQILVYSTGRGHGYNAGDVNSNQLLDPGETWTYSATETATANVSHRTTRATAYVSGSATIDASAPTYYQVLPTLRVIENPGSEKLATITTNGAALAVSDPRFELAGTALRLKSGEHLNAAADTGFVLQILTSDSPPVVVQSFKLEVVADSTPWHHEPKTTDVDDDNLTTALDALLIIIELNAQGPRTLVSEWVSQSFNYYDVNGDGQLTPLDALLVIIHLNAVGPGEGEAASDEFFSDPGASSNFLGYLNWNVLSPAVDEE